MKHFRYRTIALLVAAGLLFTACSEQKKTADKATPEKAKVESLATTPADIKKEANDLAKTTRSYAEEQKELYTQEILARLAQYNQKLIDLNRKVAMLGAQTEAQAMAEVDNFYRKKDQVAEKVRQLQAASAEAYEDLKDGMDKAIEEMDRAYDKAMSRFEK